MTKNISSMQDEIQRRAQQESEKILSEAKKEAQKIINSSKNRSEKIRTEKIKPEAATMRRKIIGSAELDGRKAIINAKEEILSKVFVFTKERLQKIAQGKDKDVNYEEIIFNMIKEAASEIDEVKLLISANKTDHSYLPSKLSSIKQELDKELNRKFDLEIIKEPHDYIGGIIVYNADKTKSYNNTIEGRLLELQSRMRGRISKDLFGK
ncbi:MAG: V-type ATP synthase subunit E family protein [Candidatus Bathyarchaeota archaeon]|nr:V-type ATP synthase subunit E family protein [Candidatus Bathyarchaeota archaeon]